MVIWKTLQFLDSARSSSIFGARTGARDKVSYLWRRSYRHTNDSLSYGKFLTSSILPNAGEVSALHTRALYHAIPCHHSKIVTKIRIRNCCSLQTSDMMNFFSDTPPFTVSPPNSRSMEIDP